MAKSKYCYIIVNEENGSMLLEDGKLPIYWNKQTAKERQVKFSNKYVVHKLELATIEKLILGSERA